MKYVKKQNVLDKLDELLSTVNILEVKYVNTINSVVSEYDEKLNKEIEEIEVKLEHIQNKSYKMIS